MNLEEQLALLNDRSDYARCVGRNASLAGSPRFGTGRGHGPVITDPGVAASLSRCHSAPLTLTTGCRPCGSSPGRRRAGNFTPSPDRDRGSAARCIDSQYGFVGYRDPVAGLAGRTQH